MKSLIKETTDSMMEIVWYSTSPGWFDVLTYNLSSTEFLLVSQNKPEFI